MIFLGKDKSLVSAGFRESDAVANDTGILRGHSFFKLRKGLKEVFDSCIF